MVQCEQQHKTKALNFQHGTKFFSLINTAVQQLKNGISCVNTKKQMRQHESFPVQCEYD